MRGSAEAGMDCIHPLIPELTHSTAGIQIIQIDQANCISRLGLLYMDCISGILNVSSRSAKLRYGWLIFTIRTKREQTEK